MSPKRKRPTKLYLTDRAVADLVAIDAYSIRKWGKRTAARYLGDIESSLRLIREDPRVLHESEGLPEALRFHRVRSHLIVCDVRPSSVVVLTVLHGSMDVSSRLAELVPTLADEVTLLHQKAASRRRR